MITVAMVQISLSLIYWDVLTPGCAQMPKTYSLTHFLRISQVWYLCFQKKCWTLEFYSCFPGHYVPMVSLKILLSGLKKEWFCGAYSQAQVINMMIFWILFYWIFLNTLAQRRRRKTNLGFLWNFYRIEITKNEQIYKTWELKAT